MHRPKEITDTLGISATTLRRWSTTFSDYLSPTAGQSIAESGGSAQRRYTDEDLALLASIQREFAGGRTVEEVQVKLKRGELQPATDVVVNNTKTGETAQRALTEPPVGETEAGRGGSVAVPGYDAHELAGVLVALNAAFPTLTETLQQVERSTAALTSATEQQSRAARELQYGIEEMRQERRALEDLRAEIVAERTPVPKAPAETPSLGSRVRRLLKGNG